MLDMALVLMDYTTQFSPTVFHILIYRCPITPCLPIHLLRFYLVFPSELERDVQYLLSSLTQTYRIQDPQSAWLWQYYRSYSNWNDFHPLEKSPDTHIQSCNDRMNYIYHYVLPMWWQAKQYLHILPFLS